MDIKCLTVHQPWAHLIVEGVKRVENRSWATKFRGRLLIHAATSRKSLDLLPTLRACGHHVDVDELRFGAIVGAVELVDCLSVEQLPPDLFVAGPWCWLLARPEKFALPIPHRGRLGLYDVPAAAVSR